jgi:predicted dehydrogenase
VGIIGLGVGELHIPGYLKHPNCDIVALCDLSEEKLFLAKEKYPGIRVTQDSDQILEAPDIDIVSIASYDNDHFKQVQKGLQNNKHLFVEKPLCLYQKEAQDIRALLDEKRELRLSSNLILRLSPRFLLLKELIEHGDFGQIYYLEGDYHYGRLHKITEGWRGQLEFYSVVYGGAVHIVDLLLWLTGDTIEEVVAYGNKIASAGTCFRYNDFVACLLKFRSGAIAKISANFSCVKPHFHALEIFGTSATYVNGQDEGYLFTSRDPNVGSKILTSAYPGVHKGELIYSFVQSIIGEAPAIVTTEDVFKTMSVCFAIEDATKRPGPVTVKNI